MKDITKLYIAGKKASKDSILLFENQDFIEAFFEDAKTINLCLGLSITKMVKGGLEMDMVGFPKNQLDKNLIKLIKAGYRVAVCNQETK